MRWFKMALSYYEKKLNKLQESMLGNGFTQAEYELLAVYLLSNPNEKEKDRNLNFCIAKEGSKAMQRSFLSVINDQPELKAKLQKGEE